MRHAVKTHNDLPKRRQTFRLATDLSSTGRSGIEKEVEDSWRPSWTGLRSRTKGEGRAESCKRPPPPSEGHLRGDQCTARLEPSRCFWTQMFPPRQGPCTKAEPSSPSVCYTPFFSFLFHSLSLLCLRSNRYPNSSSRDPEANRSLHDRSTLHPV